MLNSVNTYECPPRELPSIPVVPVHRRPLRHQDQWSTLQALRPNLGYDRPDEMRGFIATWKLQQTVIGEYWSHSWIELGLVEQVCGLKLYKILAPKLGLDSIQQKIQRCPMISNAFLMLSSRGWASTAPVLQAPWRKPQPPKPKVVEVPLGIGAR